MKTIIITTLSIIITLSACQSYKQKFIDDTQKGDCVQFIYNSSNKDEWTKSTSSIFPPHLILEKGKESFKTMTISIFTGQPEESYLFYSDINTFKQFVKTSCPEKLEGIAFNVKKNEFIEEYNKEFYNLKNVNPNDYDKINLKNVPEKLKPFIIRYNQINKDHQTEKILIKKQLDDFKSIQDKAKEKLKAERKAFSNLMKEKKADLRAKTDSMIKLIFLDLKIPENEIYLNEMENLDKGYIVQNPDQANKRLKFLSYLTDIPEFKDRYENLKKMMVK